MGEGLHGQRALAGGAGGLLGHAARHLHLRPATAVDHPRVLHRLAQHAQRVVQAALRLVQDVAAWGAAMTDLVRQAGRGTLSVSVCFPSQVWRNKQGRLQAASFISSLARCAGARCPKIRTAAWASGCLCRVRVPCAGGFRAKGELLTRPPQDDGAGRPHLHAREVDQLVLPNHDLLDQLATAQLRVLRVLEGGRNLATCSQALYLSSRASQQTSARQAACRMGRI